ncbi:hypothetical protein HKD37_09G026593 [Glycine soja]
MTGKAKPKKHTAKEIAAKVDAATTNRGGGKAGMKDRTGLEKGGHAKYECPHCKVTAPDVKSMQIHHDARHPKIPFEEDKVVNLHATTSVPESSKPRPGVRGSLKNGFFKGRGYEDDAVYEGAEKALVKTDYHVEGRISNFGFT